MAGFDLFAPRPLVNDERPLNLSQDATQRGQGARSEPASARDFLFMSNRNRSRIAHAHIILFVVVLVVVLWLTIGWLL
ncbi:MAG: hypothetical protein ACI8UO_006354 [Verrucomicrobiales bacterium]